MQNVLLQGLAQGFVKQAYPTKDSLPDESGLFKKNQVKEILFEGMKYKLFDILSNKSFNPFIRGIPQKYVIFEDTKFYGDVSLYSFVYISKII